MNNISISISDEILEYCEKRKETYKTPISASIRELLELGLKEINKTNQSDKKVKE